MKHKLRILVLLRQCLINHGIHTDDANTYNIRDAIQWLRMLKQ